MNRRRMMMKSSSIKTLLLMHGNTLADQSGNGGTIETSNYVEASSGGKFNAGQLSFGVGSYLVLTSYPLTITKKWTVDFWCKFRTLPAYSKNSLISNYTVSDVGGNSLYFGYQRTGDTYGVFEFDSVNVSYDAYVYYTVPDDWFHLACTFDGIKYTLFYNGTKILESAVIESRMDYLVIGAVVKYAAMWYLSGYISELRISDGVRWTADFTPPTAPYTI